MSAFFLFMVILLGLAALLRIDFFFTILYLFVAVYVTLRVWADRALAGLTIERAFENRAFIGDTVTVKLTITNTSRLPVPWLMVNEAIHWSLSASDSLRCVFSLRGKESQTVEYTLKPGRRGYFLVGPLVINTGDLLGLRRGLTGRLAASHLIVYPKILPLPELGLPAFSPQVVLPAPVPIFEDPARITGLRPYRWGDNPRHIHWPATAGSGQVVVKQFQPAIARESALFTNLDRRDYPRKYREYALELSIIAAASLANHMLTREKLPVGLDATALDPLTKQVRAFHLPPHREQSHLLQILEVLARVQPVDEGDFVANLRRQAVRLSWGATIVVITGQASEGLLETLLWLKESGFRPALVLVSQHPRSQHAARLAIPVFDIWREKDIEAWPAIL
ncbi:MAG: DUF58 domain-containing protein [Anaerolineae bacterium]